MSLMAEVSFSKMYPRTSLICSLAISGKGLTDAICLFRTL